MHELEVEFEFFKLLFQMKIHTHMILFAYK